MSNILLGNNKTNLSLTEQDFLKYFLFILKYYKIQIFCEQNMHLYKIIHRLKVFTNDY